ncbi:MAG: hypothetical protein COY58_02170 [Gammaproteobacteria bacterium CG_4_10_14_0_8_um_filter_38_16]|nr:MAG: hypothetical protein COY58_02170 [Gammaproteobacteria bacterium CG_4_10_14_0_8_um_filter_38_16]PJA04119.1 MAG: hypothetical protein COX72_01955 [Gammaproteobacteria bacterium CG_4_10_14_0_2_um_filter_38_22]PJB10015.1 MAG: hypothetical protein CO120_06950 [Gammaproteobacteria bacterium CG_4_9_14_3_um_filter_38_9]
MEWIRRIFLLIVIVFLLPGCTMLGTYMDHRNPAPTYHVNGHLVKVKLIHLTPNWFVQHEYKQPVYRVGPYDILNVIVYDHPELTTPTTQLSAPGQSGILVGGHGMISFPFAGTFKVAGLSIPQIQRLISKRISKYIRNPQVNVRVIKFRSQEAQVLGEIGLQRQIPLTDRPTSLLDALSIAGGTSVSTANTTSIYVIRGNLKHLIVFVLNAKSPETMMLSQRFMLMNNDIVYVSPLPVTSWNRVISQVLPSFAAVQTAQSTSTLIHQPL